MDPDDVTEEERALVKEFASNYTADPDCSPWGLTPRMALRLYSQAELMGSLAKEDPAFLTEDDWVLPPAALRSGPAFHQRFVQCFFDLADRLRRLTGDGLLARCVGDEVALDAVLNAARDAHKDGTDDDVLGPLMAELPANKEHDGDFELYSETLFEDRDFEMLWRADLDGIEDDDEHAKEFGIVNLRPDRWFLPFR